MDDFVARANESAAVATIPQIAGRWQPLCTVYRSSLLPRATASLLAGHNRADSLFSQVEMRVVEDVEFRRHGFLEEIFPNVNAPEDLERAKVELESEMDAERL